MISRRKRPAKRVTIADVASLAEVSLATVSNAINGRHSQMSNETLLRITNAIKSLDYHPSSLARGLATQHSATIGIIMEEVESPLFLSSLHVIEPAARANGYSLLMSVCRSVEAERQALSILLAKQVEGIIFFSTSTFVDEAHLIELQGMDTPVVIVNRASRLPAFYQVNWDDEGDTQKATDFLLNLGHRYIGYLAGPETRCSTRERLKGFKAALNNYGVTDRSEYIRRGDYTGSPEDWKREIDELIALSPRPTAIIASNDTVAATVMAYIQQLGIRVPEEMSIIGHDDQPFTPLLTPPLTTIREPVLQSGKKAIEMLLGRLQGDSQKAEHITIPGELIVRASTKCVANS